MTVRRRWVIRVHGGNVVGRSIDGYPPPGGQEDIEVMPVSEHEGGRSDEHRDQAFLAFDHSRQRALLVAEVAYLRKQNDGLALAVQMSGRLHDRLRAEVLLLRETIDHAARR